MRFDDRGFIGGHASVLVAGAARRPLEFKRRERTTGRRRMRLPDLTKEIRATSFVRVTYWTSASSSRRSSINRTSPSNRTALRSLSGIGDVHVAGLTVPELRKTLQGAYSKILAKPVITVTLRDFNKPYFIATGQVGKPGKYDLRANTTLIEGIGIAGGMNDTSKHSEVWVFHRLPDGSVQSKRVNVKQMLASGNLNEDARLQPGDTIFIPQNTFSKIKNFLAPSVGASHYSQQAVAKIRELRMQAELQHVLQLPGRQASKFNLRILLAALFRRRRLVLTTFVAVFVPVVLSAFFLPNDYASETKVLVQRLRFDPMISANSAAEDASTRDAMAPIVEQDVNSEIDLMESDDLLRQTAVQSGLAESHWNWRKLLRLPALPQDQRVAKATRVIRKNLDIEPPNRSGIVTLHYHSSDPQQAARVLQALTALYLERHIQVHRPAGSTEFFSQQVEQNRIALQQAEARLNEFTKAYGSGCGGHGNNSLLQKTADFDASLQTTKSQIASVQQRIHNLETQLATASPRITTQVRTTAGPVDTLKSNFYSLELKRSDLLTKYQPEYRLVQDVDKQIADTKLAIAAAEAAPSAERTTDQDPVHRGSSPNWRKRNRNSPHCGPARRRPGVP